MATPRNQPFPWKALLVLVGTYGVVYMLFLGLPLIGGSSEAREAQVIDVILREGSWALPLRNGIVPSKPILFHWVGATISWLLGGVSEFSVRLPSLVFGLGVLVVAALAAFRVAVLNRAWECSFVPRHVALITVGVLTLTYGFHTMAGQAMVDMCFAFFVWCALLAVLSADESVWSDSRIVSSGARALFWSSCAGAVLARGPIGIVLPALMVSAPAVMLFGPRTVVRELLRPSVGWLAFVAPAAWYYTAYSHGGESFVERQLLFENVRRFLGGEHVNAQPWWFYGSSLLRSTAPWSILVMVCLIAEMRRPRLAHVYGGRAKVIFCVPLIMLAASVALFSCSAGKRHSYMVPLYPLLAIQLALVGATWIERGGGRMRQRASELGRRLEWTLAVVGICLLIALGVFLNRTSIGHPLATEIQAALAAATPRLGSLILVATLPCLVWSRKSLKGTLFSVWAGLVVLMTGLVSTGASVKAHLKNFKGMSVYWLAQADRNERLTVIKDPFDEYFDPILWYVHRRVDVIRSDHGVHPCAEERLYLVHRQWLERSNGLLEGRISEVGTLQEIGTVVKEGERRELVMFRCQPYLKSSSENSAAELLDAGSTDHRGNDRAALDDTA